MMVEVLFWLCFAVVAYTYVGYPLWLAVRGRWGQPIVRGPYAGSVSVVLAVHNEAKHLPRRLEELTGLLARFGSDGEIVVASDGSTDDSVVLARSWQNRGVRVVELTENQGKAVALTKAVEAATGEILVFADARQTWAPDALEEMLQNFADPTVGAVSGDLVLETAPGVLAGVGLYWRLEKWLRKQESRIHAQVGVTGAISAVRRSLFRPIPAGTLLDDVYWPMQVALQGYRVVHEERARAFDRLPDKSRDEFRRKVRTLCGNFQLAARLPSSLVPGQNPVWFAWVSHKLLRLVVPWALLGLLLTNLLLDGEAYRLFLLAQGCGYLLALLGLVPAIGQRIKLAGAGASFLVLNAAAWVAFWVWITGRADKTWRKVTYAAPPQLVEPS